MGVPDQSCLPQGGRVVAQLMFIARPAGEVDPLFFFFFYYFVFRGPASRRSLWCHNFNHVLAHF